MPLLILHLFEGPSQNDRKPLTSPQTIFVEDRVAASKPLAAVIREQVVLSNRYLSHYSDHGIVSAVTGAGNSVKQIMHLPIAIFFESIKFDVQKTLYVVIPPLHFSPKIGIDMAWMGRTPLRPPPQHSSQYTHSCRPSTTAFPPLTPYNVVTPSFPTPQNIFPTPHQWEGNNHGGNYSSSFIQQLPLPPALPLPNSPTWPRRSGVKRPSSSLYEYNPPNHLPTTRPFPPRPPQLRKRYHNTATTASAEDRTKSCSKCNKTLAWELFSKRQWINRDELRQCKNCVEETLPLKEIEDMTALDPSQGNSPASTIIPQEIISSGAADTAKDAENKANPMHTTTPADGRTKPCSKCNKTLPWEHFSKRQWTNRDDVRQCKNCVEKVRPVKKPKDNKISNLDNLPDKSGDLSLKNQPEIFSGAPDTASNVDNNTVADRTKPCSKCNKTLSWRFFPKRQWTNHDEIRQCRDCLAQSSAAPEQKNFSLKTCNMCQKSLPAFSFSKRQWNTRADARLCMECVNRKNVKMDVTKEFSEVRNAADHCESDNKSLASVDRHQRLYSVQCTSQQGVESADTKRDVPIKDELSSSD